MRLSSADDVRDNLTGLPGMAGAASWFARHQTEYVHAMLIGLHRFRTVNLAYGHAGGDSVLAEIARRIADFTAEELEADALVARVGGGEFLVASSGAISRERWQWLAEALTRHISRSLPMRGDELHLVPRTALLRGLPGEDGAALIDRLDQALGTLQQQTGRRLLWADGSHRARGRSAARLEADLIGAMARDEIGLVFQPQYAVAGGLLVGVEALARWDHPQLGRMGAETLFAIAERGDHVTQLSRHIARKALSIAAAWQEQLALSLNVTAEDLANDRFAMDFTDLLEAMGFSPARLTLEVTEHALVADFARSSEALAELAGLGVRIALDDFGTGYANFRTLKALPLDTIKLDASLLRDVDTDNRDRAILTAIVAMARALGLKLVCEGVERESQLAVLAEEGCDTFQGFLRSGPVGADEIAALI
ncbi:GGDEF domain-containing phosphodiesterase [Novosphingobium taihuense]|uniref:Diguanylate cyclase (GGDEF)-like protein n=2 Tax=Novosphingobium taihuense TaxID=260085 RepID=A0A7W7ABD5_9SPHN|nr:GGDEF domain-containing phosphodiesterase [Novosphingobium taihuense]MBB4613888.1 diguanylate cyclase (GGDEF)-like protein [Novosphingobium taihuense]